MGKLYEKNELNFSLLWIGVYVIAFSIADNISAGLGTAKIVTAPVCVLMTAFLLGWIKRNGLTEKYGLGKVKIDGKPYLYFLPLILIVSHRLWNGVTLRLSVWETVLHVISMIGVGILEEVIFRGFLFKAMCRENVKQAMIISSLTFGIGHIVNLLNGAEVLTTLLQICFAAAIGFVFVIIFHKSGSLIPCIITHGMFNSLSAFKVKGTEMEEMLTVVALTVVSIAYALWILKNTKKEECA